MRKRKRGQIEYEDEETGEVSIVQTTKQVKRNHNKSGKWYKEPTEAELRSWDREEKRQAAADRALRREENKKLNAAKRAEKEAKENERRQQQFEAGKITFTQTLAKKDEDQLNLHSWFGGKPKHKPQAASVNGAKTIADKEVGGQVNKGSYEKTVEDVTRSKLRSPSQHSETDSDDEDLSQPRSKHDTNTNTKFHPVRARAEVDNMDSAMDQLLQIEDFGMSPDFEIAEDSDVEPKTIDQMQGSDVINPFKVPALPTHAGRLPLSPMSKSEVNIRVGQSTQVSSFKGKLEKAAVFAPPSTQIVRDLLSGICTQDLTDDLEDDVLSFPEDKENNEPEFDTQSTVHLSDPCSPLKQKNLPSVSTTIENKSFISASDSCDYDTIFAELDTNIDDQTDQADLDDFDCGLNDSDLLSFPATQAISQAKISFKQLPAHPEPDSTTDVNKTEKISFTYPNKPKVPLKKADSFAIEGLCDDDLDKALEQFEQSQKRSHTHNPTPKVPILSRDSSTASSSTSLTKKKRVLPWQMSV